MTQAPLSTDRLALLESQYDGPIPRFLTRQANDDGGNAETKQRLLQIADLVLRKTNRIIESQAFIEEDEARLAELTAAGYDPTDVRPGLIRAHLNSHKRCIEQWTKDIEKLEAEADRITLGEWNATLRDMVLGSDPDAEPVGQPEDDEPDVAAVLRF